MRGKFLLAICLGVLGVMAGAVVADDGLALMKVEAGARAAGMGGAFVSIGGDPYSSFYNPAGSASARQFSGSFGHTAYWENIRLETGYFSSPLSRSVSIHGGIRWANLGDLEIRTGPSTTPDALSDANDVSFKTGLSYQVDDKIFAGFSLGWYMEKIEAYRGTAFNLDFGALVIPNDEVTFGVSITNLGKKMNLTKEGAETSRDITLPTTYRVGISYKYRKYLGAADAVIVDNKAHIHLGVESPTYHMIALRAGYMFNYDTKNFTAGTSITWRNMAFEYAFVPYTSNLGTTHLLQPDLPIINSRSYTSMAKYKIAWLPGDGVGNDVMEAAKIVLEKVKLDAEYIHGDIGWEFWSKEGNPLPGSDHRSAQETPTARCSARLRRFPKKKRNGL